MHNVFFFNIGINFKILFIDPNGSSEWITSLLNFFFKKVIDFSLAEPST